MKAHIQWNDLNSLYKNMQHIHLSINTSVCVCACNSHSKHRSSYPLKNVYFAV